MRGQRYLGHSGDVAAAIAQPGQLLGWAIVRCVLGTRSTRHVGQIGQLFRVGQDGRLRQAPVPLAVFALVLFHVQGIRRAAQGTQCDTGVFGIGLDGFGRDVSSAQYIGQKFLSRIDRAAAASRVLFLVAE